MIKILVKNDSDHQMKILRKFRLNVVIKIDYKNCFQADLNSKYAFITSSKKFK